MPVTSVAMGQGVPTLLAYICIVSYIATMHFSRSCYTAANTLCELFLNRITSKPRIQYPILCAIIYHLEINPCQFTMSSKPASTRQAWTEKERDDIRSQHALHPSYSYPDIKRWFDEKYAPKTISKSQISPRLFRLQNPHVNIKKGGQVGDIERKAGY